ncbi:MAG: MarR family winged helix-turn-helix transcriptional regulator [Alphaproteobacteria bacterium]
MNERAKAFYLGDFLPYRLSVVTNRISRAFAGRYASAFGLSIPEWRVMAVLGSFAPLTANQVAELTAMDKTKVSRAVARLARAGHLKRAANPGDRRSSRLALTAKGRGTHGRIVPLARMLEAELVAALAPGERARLDAALDKLDAWASRAGSHFERRDACAGAEP